MIHARQIIKHLHVSENKTVFIVEGIISLTIFLHLSVFRQIRHDYLIMANDTITVI